MHAPATRRRAAEPHLAKTKEVEFGPVRNIANLPVLWNTNLVGIEVNPLIL